MNASTQISKPMLAVNCSSLEALHLPALATPKLDGIRCLKIGGRALSRSFKPIPNRYVREWIEEHVPDGCDGELLLRSGTFSESSGAIAREEGTPDFLFSIFDYVDEDGVGVPYFERMNRLRALELNPAHTSKVLPVKISSLEALAEFEASALAAGHEGVMVRTPDSPYKCGRSTEAEGFLLKIKRFTDSEATVLGYYEQLSNQNEAMKDAFGRTKRSSAAEGKVPTGGLGGFVVRDSLTGQEFRLGYNHVTGGIARETIWLSRASLVGREVKYRHQSSGAKDAPRFPTFLGFREPWDK